MVATCPHLITNPMELTKCTFKNGEGVSMSFPIFFQLQTIIYVSTIGCSEIFSMSFYITLAVVNSLGNLKLCDPVDCILGKFPAFGITFQASFNVTLS